ncbi:hypothetical protein Hypma_010869 [Hypsizygus marmoreus]|uniref:Uncharacterized protein n=1 Tax=Hypsizygus marmoreus TaxID=39966 RepID=A0A369JI41_HYPMA|nr:hypothetical protein Hypma_010869 [Hypsizygus marmoreus]
MNYTQPICIAEPCNPSDSSTISAQSISSLPVLLTASVVFLAVDAAVSILRRRSYEQKLTSTASAATPPPPCRALKHLVAKTKGILSDVDALEKRLEQGRLHIDTSSSGNRHRLRRRQHPLASTAAKDNTTPYTCSRKAAHQGLSTEFSAFCDRLLLTNHIWKQEKQLKSLRAATKSKTQTQHATAFKTFCDELLLWNRIWKLEREAKALVEEGERLKRSRVAAITRAAKRMVLDVQKERMVEEFVKDMIGEVEEGKRELERLREEHEREVREIEGEWVKEYRGVVRELERLRLAQSARMVEQEVANELEDGLCESLREGKRHVQELEEKLAALAKEEWGSSNEDTLVDASTVYYSHDDETTDVELDTVSELSSSSTCVGFSDSGHRSTDTTSPGSGTNPQRRRRCVSHGPKGGSLLLKSATIPNVDPVAFTLKPLIIDQADALATLDANLAVATRICNHSGRPLAIRNRTTSVSLRRPTKSSSFAENRVILGKATTAGGKGKAPWRF